MPRSTRVPFKLRYTKNERKKANLENRKKKKKNENKQIKIFKLNAKH